MLDFLVDWFSYLIVTVIILGMLIIGYNYRSDGNFADRRANGRIFFMLIFICVVAFFAFVLIEIAQA